jgi:hypothetical protein
VHFVLKSTADVMEKQCWLRLSGGLVSVAVNFEKRMVLAFFRPGGYEISMPEFEMVDETLYVRYDAKVDREYEHMFDEYPEAYYGSAMFVALDRHDGPIEFVPIIEYR